MAKYILVDEEADPDGGCEIWLYAGEETCDKNCVVAVAETENVIGDEAEFMEGGFHVAHTCRAHGEYLVEKLNAGL